MHVDLLLKNRNIFRGRLLDAGCGVKPYSLIYDALVEESIGVDTENCIHDNSNIDVFASLDNLPFKNDEFDVVLCTNVLEHVSDFNKSVSELIRVLKPNGKLVISIPFLYPIHEAPYDFQRLTKFGFLRLITQNDLKILTFFPLGGPVLLAIVWTFLGVNRFLHGRVGKKLSAILQNTIYKLWIKPMMKRQLMKGIPEINFTVTCGYFLIAEKKIYN